MKPIIDFLISLIFLLGYCYTLIAAHLILARIDKKMQVPRNASGEITLKELKVWVLPELKDVETDIKKSIMLLRFSNLIVYVYIALFICSVLSSAHHSFSTPFSVTTIH